MLKHVKHLSAAGVRAFAAMMLLQACIAPALCAAATASPQAPASAPAASHVAVLTADQVIKILDQTVEWYRTLGTQQQTTTEPSDLLMLYANRQIADQVITLAFQVARANAELLSSEASSAQTSANSASSSSEALAALRTKLAGQSQATRAQIDSLRREIATASARSKASLEAKLTELQSELAMTNARRNLLDTMGQFVDESNTKVAAANALKAQIDAIAASIPASGGASPSSNAAPSAASTAIGFGAGSERLGIWDLMRNAIRLSEKSSTLSVIDQRTAALAKTFVEIRSAPLEQLKALSAQSDALTKQDDSSNGALNSARDQLDTLAWLFKQTSAILIPLSKEGILLQEYRHNLSSWRNITRGQYRDALVALAVRVGTLLLFLAIVFVGGELWKRAVLRYVHDPRRRFQLLLLRRISLWIVLIAIVGLTFVTQLSSFATFAGLITAGVAVAMQSVLVSIVGYFFLIGRYGIRVGDRVQIGDVRGEVIEIGLVRMHLMELSPQGVPTATGRVVAFANSIVFQSSGGLFRQIPGVDFVWHEITLPLPAVGDHAAIKEKLQVAVNAVIEEYREDIVQQTRKIEQTTSSGSVGGAMPQVQLRFSAGGVEAHVRYPVQLQHAAEIDERVSKELSEVVSGQ